MPATKKPQTAKTQQEGQLALDAIKSELENALEQEQQETEQGPEDTGYVSSANGNNIYKLANGNYQEYKDGLPVGTEYPEQMFTFALNAGFLVKAELLAKPVQVKEIPTLEYRIDFIESVSLKIKGGLSTSLTESLESCYSWEGVKAKLEENGIDYEMTAYPVKCSISRLGAKKGRASGSGEGNKMTQLQKLKCVRLYLPKALNDYPQFLEKLSQGMNTEEMKALQAKMIGQGKKYWKDIPSYLKYANLGSNPLGYTKDIVTGIVRIDRIPSLDELLNYDRNCNE